MAENFHIKTDIEIAQASKMVPIIDIAKQLDIRDDELEPFGKYKAKINLKLMDRLQDQKEGKVILVTSINPTPAGEGKSTVTVGLGQALHQIGKKAIIAIREPSLGPSMGIKGGAAGGGYSQVVPMEDINLHFTGDLHAITTANNALAALIDNHIHHGNELKIDIRRVVWKRALDLNDRALRHITIGLGGPTQGVPREDGFDITVASEIMAIFCLARNLKDLKERLANIVIGLNLEKQPVTVKDLGVEGALTLLLKDAIHPNLVQTIENTPALIHGGPFANIAHGCNSILATKMAAKLGDYVVTEAGFGADLGAEKFLNIKARYGEINPSLVVIVATIRALKMHGGVKIKELHKENLVALETGMSNLQKHIETIQKFRLPFIVSLNHFIHDTDKKVQYIEKWCKENNYPFSIAKVWEKGGEGGKDLARKIVNLAENTTSNYSPLYRLDASLQEKIETIARIVYGADGVNFESKALSQIEQFDAHGWGKLPICVAKTQYSLSDDPGKLGRPTGFTITVRELKASIGAGFIVVLTGKVMTMPGLPKNPSANKMDVTDDGKGIGLF